MNPVCVVTGRIFRALSHATTAQPNILSKFLVYFDIPSPKKAIRLHVNAYL